MRKCGTVAEPSRRLTSRIDRDFDAGTSTEIIGQLSALDTKFYGGQNVERVQAALVLSSAGSWRRFAASLRLLRTDWRDVLVAGGLADEDWPQRLDAELRST